MCTLFAFLLFHSLQHLPARTLQDLDTRIQAWGGIGSLFTEWRGMRNLGFLGSLIPLYFVAGAGVHLAGSGVLGVFL